MAEPTTPTLVLASGNAGKLREFQTLLADLGMNVLPQSTFKVNEVAETGLTFVENALIKARHAAQVTGLPALADDSGLEVDALRGQPGIYSARFAGPDATDEQNNQLLLKRLEGLQDTQRSARYWCVLVLMRHALDPTPLICQASWQGQILSVPRGQGGFGYDPLFWLPEQNCSAAELDDKTKNTLSHRGRAMHLLLEQLHQRSSWA